MAYTSYSGGIPSRQDPTNFSDYMDTWIAWYTPNATELASLMAGTTFIDTGGDASAWVSGASYTAGDAVYSTVDWQTYRAKTTHSGETTDPSSDGTNWVQSVDLSLYMPLSGGTFSGAVTFSGAITLTGGATATLDDDGTQSTGTYTPSLAAGGQYKKIVNGGAFTLAPPSLSNDQATTLSVFITNNASAGAITTSGFTMVGGDDFTTTDGDDFLCLITVYDIGGTEYSFLDVRAMQ